MIRPIQSMTIRALLLPCLLVCTLCVVPPTAVRAQDAEEVLLHQEDFDDGQARGWYLESEGDGEVGWVIRDGKLEGIRHYWAIYEGGEWFDTHLALTVYLHEGFEGLNISVRLGETGRYFLTLNPGNVALAKQVGFGVGERFETVGGREHAFDPGIPHGVSLSVYGGRVLVVIDGETFVDWTDPDPLPAGRIALETLDDGYVQVDDVRVYGPPPEEPGDGPPNVEEIEPNQVRRGSQVEINLFGSNFQPEAWVEVDGQQVHTRWVDHISDGHLQALVEAEEGAPLGWRDVVVINPDERIGSLERALEVVDGRDQEAPGPPSVEEIEPNQVGRGSQVEINLFGSNFQPEAWVEVGGQQVRTHWVDHISDGHLQALVEAEAGAPLGWRDVVVINPDEQVGSLQRALEVVDSRDVDVPGQPALHEVVPHEVEPGAQVELTLIGEHLTLETEVQFYNGGIEVRQVRYIDPSRLVVGVAVTDDAAPGPRPVEVSTLAGTDILPEGLLVLEPPPGPPAPGPEPSPTSPVETPGPPAPAPQSSPASPGATPVSGTMGQDGAGGLAGLLWPGATVLLCGASFALGRTLGIKTKLTWTDKARLQWHVEAQNELPEAKRWCQWACKANVSAALLDRWQVDQLQLTPLPVRGAPTLPAKQVKGSVLAPLNDLANIALILDSEEETRRRVKPVVDALLTQFAAWEKEGQTPASVRLEANMKAPINAKFELYHCKQTAGGLDWGKPLVTWKHKLNQPGGEELGVLRGPTAGEVDFAVRARRELENCLLDLLSAIQFRV